MPTPVIRCSSTDRIRTCGGPGPQRSASCRPRPVRLAPPGRASPPGPGDRDGVAVRVPVEDGSLTDLVVVVSRDVTAEAVNEAFAAAGSGLMAGILRYSTDPLVSRDIIGDPASCVFDSALTQASGTLGKGFGWYDDEPRYTNPRAG